MREFAAGALLKDRYRLERLLGRGGMAAVWLGHDDVLDRLVAIKVLSDTISSDPDYLARFRREARVAAGLTHPNLVEIYDYSESGERPYLVMEFVPGRDLGSRIAAEGWIDRDKLARELLGAVAHIHAAGIVHRDIKPHNILLEEDRTAKLIDFGIALPPDATVLTQTGLILATRRYAAPEVLAGEPASPRSDLFSCGVVLEACGIDGSEEVRSLVSSLTAKDPDRRPAGAREALARLEDTGDRGQATMPFTPTFERPAPAAAERPALARAARGEKRTGRRDTTRADLGETTRVYSPRASKRKRWIAAGAILGVAAAVVVAVVLAAGSGGGSGSGGGPGSSSGGPSATASAKKAGSGLSKSQAAKEPGSQAGVGAAQETSEEEAGEEEAGGELLEEEPSEEELGEEPASTEAPTTTAVDVPAPEGDDPGLGSSLNQEGYALIQAGSPEAAVPILERAVRSFPAGTEEVEYAYALFNLGDALLRSGRPEAAIPVLEERLQIPDQTETVERELQTAREEAE